MSVVDGLKNSHTVKEIWQQPQIWRKTYQIVSKQITEITSLIKRANHSGNLRVIISGAGSSAFVGEIVVPYLSKITPYNVEAIATTDIVSTPENYLRPEVPTLLISCARSGNSPESVATVELAEKLVKDLYQIVITCNPDSALAAKVSTSDQNLLLLMPEDANDKGFAMTGSFTSMALAILLLFNPDKLSKLEKDITLIANWGEEILQRDIERIHQLASWPVERAVFLGSSTLTGLARESALKLLELTSGGVASIFDSSLGFRHGPKSILNNQTVVFSYISQDRYTREYELDLLREMASENGGKKLVAISRGKDEDVAELVDQHFYVTDTQTSLEDDVFWAFPYILYAHVFALIKSERSGIDPDNPSQDGAVNRVVKGVKIYPYNK